MTAVDHLLEFDVSLNKQKTTLMSIQVIIVRGDTYRLYILQMTQATDTLHARAWAEFFQGRAPGESRGGLPVIFQIPGGGVLNRGFWSLRWSK